ncbi:FAD-binding oxidoreductase [Sphingomonas sp. QA11]|uniref:NAD(P)/FAD-dependent oxidoreductase n=1 Tax=Sphingomonas sp. QA11 TaxID=2950605 RepID=UPI00234B7C08|nr:FAD-binding oxidoreductase [Sphingomonas sp. QA11]WCM28228.1 FAD-binding oxidoreductase [Sphingomonas sp. QA11]
MDLTERRDLRGGHPCWVAIDDNTLTSDPIPSDSVDIAIVGAGVMGAMLGERLSGEGRRVLLLDRRPPAHGSTAASTALVMWAADVPLTRLAGTIGMAEAARRWRRVFAAVERLAARIDDAEIECGRIDRPELYLAGTLLDEQALRAEAEARRAAGLPSDYLDAATVAGRFDIAPRAALLSAGSYEVDPVRLTLGLLAKARARGAAACFPFDVARIEQTGGGSMLHGADGRRIEAKTVILAPGYERAVWFLPAAFTVGSSYAIATAPGRAPLWRENAMIWEASSPYLYTRATADGRVIAGGEDEDFDDARQRDALIETKRGTISAKLAAMIAVEDITVDCAWAAAFGSSPDGLPAIGRARNHDNLWLASGFGGNGVSFAALGTELIAAALSGATDPDAECFDPYRFS